MLFGDVWEVAVTGDLVMCCWTLMCRKEDAVPIDLVKSCSVMYGKEVAETTELVKCCSVMHEKLLQPVI